MIIDFHTHIFPSFFRIDRGLLFSGEPDFKNLYGSPESKLSGAKDLIKNMDDEGIDRSVVFGFPWKDTDHFKRHNDYIIESVQKYPDRLIGFACFDLTSGEAPKEAERCLKAGLSGIGELAVYDRDFSEGIIEALNDTMETASKYNVPVILHTNEPVGHLYPGKQPITLTRLYALLKKFSDNRIILAHWGGGLFLYELLKKEAKDVLRNVWFDTAASPFLYTPDIYRIAAEIIGENRILFGSDYPLIRPGRYFNELESSGLSTESILKIKGGNAAILAGIKDPPA